MSAFQKRLLFVGLLVALGRAALADEPGSVRFGINCHLGFITQNECPGIIRPTSEDRTNYLDAVRDPGRNHDPRRVRQLGG